jgi:hypothetical protein
MPTYTIPIRRQRVGATFGFDPLQEAFQAPTERATTFDAPAPARPLFVTQESSSLPSYEPPGSLTSYKELEAALVDLHALDADDEWRIDESVYKSSVQVAAILMDHRIPTPGVFTHGRRSVVLNWTRARDNLYLTITHNTIYVMISSPREIKYRGELGTALTNRTTNFFSALGSAQLNSPPLLEHQPSSGAPPM